MQKFRLFKTVHLSGQSTVCEEMIFFHKTTSVPRLDLHVDLFQNKLHIDGRLEGSLHCLVLKKSPSLEYSISKSPRSYIRFLRYVLHIKYYKE